MRNSSMPSSAKLDPVSPGWTLEVINTNGLWISLKCSCCSFKGNRCSKALSSGYFLASAEEIAIKCNGRSTYPKAYSQETWLTLLYYSKSPHFWILSSQPHEGTLSSPGMSMDKWERYRVFYQVGCRPPCGDWCPIRRWPRNLLGRSDATMVRPRFALLDGRDRIFWTLLWRNYCSREGIHTEEGQMQILQSLSAEKGEVEPCFWARFDLLILPESEFHFLHWSSVTLLSRLTLAELRFPESKSPLTSTHFSPNTKVNDLFFAVGLSFSINYTMFKYYLSVIQTQSFHPFCSSRKICVLKFLLDSYVIIYKCWRK